MTTRARNRRLFDRTSRNLEPARPRRRAVLPFMESLENRLVLANFTVTTLADVDSPGQLTLRDAITQANQLNEASTITIPSSLYSPSINLGGLTGPPPLNDAIQLSGTELPTITSDISIVGEPPPPDLGLSSGNIFSFTISAGGNSRVFEVGSTGSLSLDLLVIENGSATGDGGAILNQGTLSLDQVTVQDSNALNGGGAILNQGTLSLDQVTVQDSNALNGGGIADFATNGSMTIRNSTIANNTALLGGGIASVGPAVLIDNSTITNNKAEARGGGVFTSGASVTFSNDRISNNAVTGSNNTNVYTGSGEKSAGQTVAGGGLFIAVGSVSITSTTVSGNVAQAGKGGPGADGTGYGSNNSVPPPFANGKSGTDGGNGVVGGAGGQASGGGIAFDSGALTISDSTLSDNTALGGTGGDGGDGGRGEDGEVGADVNEGSGSQIFPPGSGGMGGFGGGGWPPGGRGWPAAPGGGIFVGDNASALTMMNTTVADNHATGGQGGQGGKGGAGGNGGQGGSGIDNSDGPGVGGVGGYGNGGGESGVCGIGQGGGIQISVSTTVGLIASSTIAFNNASVGTDGAGGAGGAGGRGGFDGEPSTHQEMSGGSGRTGSIGKNSFPSSGGGIGYDGSADSYNFTLDNTIVAANIEHDELSGGLTASDIAGILTQLRRMQANLIGTGGAGGLTDGLCKG